MSASAPPPPVLGQVIQHLLSSSFLAISAPPACHSLPDGGTTGPQPLLLKMPRVIQQIVLLSEQMLVKVSGARWEL